MEPNPLFRFDQDRRERGFSFVAGVDEAGRGPWAGPVAAAAVILKPGASLEGLNDSKKLTPAKRERLFDTIRRESLHFSVALVEPGVIDRINILQATFLAMRHALETLGAKPDLVLVDGNRPIPQCPYPQEAVTNGDGRSAAMAAASILAKVTRDRLMKDAHQKFPHYGFHRHKGYGTPEHLEALRTHGPCALHRLSFAPVRETALVFKRKTDTRDVLEN